MSIDYIGPNQKGTAKRHHDKVVRCGTHLSVLKQVFGVFSPQSAVEHGCGYNSTKFFSDRCKLISIEDVKEWRINLGQIILSFEEFINSPSECDCILIDGRNETERLRLLDVIVKNRLAKFIVLHDAESYQMAPEILKLVDEHGYTAHQYINENPETFLFIDKNEDVSKFDFTGYV